MISTQKIPRNDYKHYYIIFGPNCPPQKGPKRVCPKCTPDGSYSKNKLPTCSIHHFERPCKKSAQTDKQFLRYSIFKTLGIWLAKSFLAIFRAIKLKIAISPQRILPEKSFCTLSSLEKSSFDDFLGLFCDCDWAKGPKWRKTKKSYRLVFWKNCPKSRKKILVA